jgi:hypothetical protein
MAVNKDISFYNYALAGDTFDGKLRTVNLRFNAFDNDPLSGFGGFDHELLFQFDGSLTCGKLSLRIKAMENKSDAFMLMVARGSSGVPQLLCLSMLFYRRLGPYGLLVSKLRKKAHCCRKIETQQTAAAKRKPSPELFLDWRSTETYGGTTEKGNWTKTGF